MTQSLVAIPRNQAMVPAGRDRTDARRSRRLLPFLVIVLALFLQGRCLPTPWRRSTGRLPFAATPAITSRSGPTVAGGLRCSGCSRSARNGGTAITITLVGIVICLSLVVLTGFVGQISLAQMTFAGVAGFTLSKLVDRLERPVPDRTAARRRGRGTSSDSSTAIPALRVRGVNLAIVTLAVRGRDRELRVQELVVERRTRTGRRFLPPASFGLQFGPNDVTTFGDGKLPTPGSASSA